MDALTQGVVPVVQSVRGETVESVHFGVVVAVDVDGGVRLSAGDPDAVTFLRSSVKPFQAMPVIAAGVPERFGLTDEEVAIIIGSHSGEDRHVAVVKSLLEKAGVPETALQCGAHPPYHDATRLREERAGRPLEVLRNNCSGKHAGMLALARFLDAPLDSYLEPTHPVQRQILEALAACAGVTPEAIRLGVDGCGVPSHALPMRAAALAFARLVDPSDLPDPWRRPAGEVVRLMRAHPYLIAGEGRLDTVLMEAAAGSDLIAKEGYEGFYSVGFRDREGTAVGLALKLADGRRENRAREFLMVEVLQALGVLGEKTPVLAAAAPTELVNHAGRAVGRFVRGAEF